MLIGSERTGAKSHKHTDARARARARVRFKNVRNVYRQRRAHDVFPHSVMFPLWLNKTQPRPSGYPGGDTFRYNYKLK